MSQYAGRPRLGWLKEEDDLQELKLKDRSRRKVTEMELCVCVLKEIKVHRVPDEEFVTKC